MHNNLKLTWLIVAFAWLLSVNLAAAQLIVDNDRSLQDIDVEEHLGEAIPLDLTFVASTGDTVQMADYFDGERPVLLTLAYYDCPMLCTLVLNGLTKGIAPLEWRPGERYRMLTVSIDPKETPQLALQKQKTYVESLNKEGITDGWVFHVGQKADIDSLANALGFQYYYVEDRDEYAHPAVVFILTPEGKISRYLYGLNYNPNDLKLGLLEASQGKIGNTIEKLLLYCFHYDPQSGSYVVFAQNVMRLGGLFTLLLLGSVIGALLWREKRRKSYIGQKAFNNS